MTDASELEKRFRESALRYAERADSRLVGEEFHLQLIARDAIAYARQCEDRAREMEAALQAIIKASDENEAAGYRRLNRDLYEQACKAIDRASEGKREAARRKRERSTPARPQHHG